VFLLSFNLILLKPEAIFDKVKQVFIILTYAGVLTIFFLVGMLGGVRLGPSTNWNPEWEFPFFLTVLGICIPSLIIPILYYSLQIYNKFENEELREKWKFFLIGILLYFIMWCGTCVSNLLAEKLVRDLWTAVSFISLLSTYTIYYGVGKEIN
jgi:hypothetical protein